MIRVGPAGWDYPDWEGVFYPIPRPRPFDRLAFIADFFDVVELNVTFYRQPDRRQAAAWVQRLGDRGEFRFTAKLHRSLTHPEAGIAGPNRGRSGRDGGGPRDRNAAAQDSPASAGGGLAAAAEMFRDGIEPLVRAGRLLAVLMQFPQSFDLRPRHREHLEILASLLRGLPLVAEFRHRSWNGKEVLDDLRRWGVGFCNIDQPSLGATLPPTSHATSSIAYVRLHGRNARNWFRRSAQPFERYDYLYSMEELDPWIRRIEELAGAVEQVVVIANNHYRGKGPANGLMMKSALERRRVKAPSTLVEAYPSLEGRVVASRRSPAQGRLF